MGTNESSSGAFRIRREPEGLQVVVPVKSDGFRILLNLVWIAVWAAGELALLLFLSGDLGPAGPAPPFAGLFLAAFSVAGGVVLWRSLWILGGREVFRIARSGLTARREIWGLGRTRTLAAGQIRSVRAGLLESQSLHPARGLNLVGQAGGAIVITHAEGSCCYGKGLGEGEAGVLAELLKAELGIQARPPSPLRRHAAFLN